MPEFSSEIDNEDDLDKMSISDDELAQRKMDKFKARAERTNVATEKVACNDVL